MSEGTPSPPKALVGLAAAAARWAWPGPGPKLGGPGPRQPAPATPFFQPPSPPLEEGRVAPASPGAAWAGDGEHGERRAGRGLRAAAAAPAGENAHAGAGRAGGEIRAGAGESRLSGPGE